MGWLSSHHSCEPKDPEELSMPDGWGWADQEPLSPHEFQTWGDDDDDEEIEDDMEWEEDDDEEEDDLEDSWEDEEEEEDWEEWEEEFEEDEDDDAVSRRRPGRHDWN
jgi:hypothetical protein